jgi:hypothetical protein
MQKTKKIVGFVVECYELETYWSRETFKRRSDFNDGYTIVPIERCLVTPPCYKRTYYGRFNSVRKLNKALGLKNGLYYYFPTSLEEALKGKYGNGYYVVQESPKTILIVRQLHDLDNCYRFKP